MYERLGDLFPNRAALSLYELAYSSLGGLKSHDSWESIHWRR